VQKVVSWIKKFSTIWRWALVGVTTTLVDYVIFIFIFSILRSVLTSNLISGLLSITFNYLSHYFWSFRSKSNHSRAGIRYFVNLLIFWAVGTLFLSILISAEIDPKIAKLIPLPLTAPLSLLSLNFFVFQKYKL
jgi:putative flippase GtrA